MLPNEFCDIPDQVCCDTLFEIADQLREIAVVALDQCGLPLDCNDPDSTGEIASYVYHSGQVEDPVPDYLAVALTSFGPATSSTDQYGSLKKMPQFVARFQVRLLEKNWPMIQTDDAGRMWIPEASLLSQLSKHSYAHGEAMYRALARAVIRGTLTGCGQQTIGNLFPIPPSGGTVGWEVEITVTVDMSGGPGGS